MRLSSPEAITTLKVLQAISLDFLLQDTKEATALAALKNVLQDGGWSKDGALVDALEGTMMSLCAR